MLYLLHEAPPEEQNFEMLMFMIENAAAMEDDEEYAFTRKQKEALETLLENADGFIGAAQSLAISDEARYGSRKQKHRSNQTFRI